MVLLVLFQYYSMLVGLRSYDYRIHDSTTVTMTLLHCYSLIVVGLGHFNLRPLVAPESLHLKRVMVFVQCGQRDERLGFWALKALRL